MKVSRNEMIAALSRAFEGSGHNIGDYEDAAHSVTWSHMVGLSSFDNIEIPPPSPKGGATPRLVFENNSTAIIDAGGADVCEHGSLAAQLAYSKSQKDDFAIVQLTNCRYPSLILYCLSLVALRGLYISVYWQDSFGSHGASFESGEAFPSYWLVCSDTEKMHSIVSTITITCTRIPSLLADAVARQVEHPEIERKEFSAAQLSANYSQSLEHGISVSEEHWQSLNAAAWPILVPSDQLSRTGAGPG
ncbi:MAG: DUF3726 domain-containing protein [Arenicella sp.]